MSSAQDTYRLFSSLVDEPSALLDSKGLVVQANNKMFDLFGEQIIGLPIERFIRSPQFADALAACQSGKRNVDLDYRRMTQTPQDYHLRLGALDEAHTILIAVDRTDAVTVNRVHSDFVANASHELRSPLTALAGFIETLQDGAAADEQTRSNFLDIMGSEAARMTRLIDGLLSLSRVERDEHRAPQDAVDLGNILQRVLDMMQGRAQERDIGLSLQIDDAIKDSAVKMRGHADEVQQVFVNLVENAIRYGELGKPVLVHVSLGRINPAEIFDENLIRVRVINQGPPIAEEHLARLTERFFRIDKGRSRDMGGTGLGLAIVKHIVNRHRGRLRITSTQENTVFSVTFPRFQQS